jgi:adenylate cyclase
VKTEKTHLGERHKMLEIERKYLVNSEDFKILSRTKHYIKQGFLSTHPERTVRVRVKDRKGMLTVKGSTSKDGTTRFEWEMEIPIDEAKALLKLCEEGIIEKYRYEIPYKNLLFEVDEFLGDNQGLFLAEVELSSADQLVDKPDWLGNEVTGEIRYYNSQLSKIPYSVW